MENNHTLYGFHFMGNGSAVIDCRGHLYLDKTINFNNLQQLNRPIMGISIVENNP